VFWLYILLGPYWFVCVWSTVQNDTELGNNLQFLVSKFWRKKIFIYWTDHLVQDVNIIWDF